MKSKVQILVTDFGNINGDQYCYMHAQAFQTLFQKNKVVENPFTADYFNWKYNGPGGKAKLGIALDNGQIVGSVSMVPLHIIHNGKIQLGWHTGDVAVLPGFSGRFLFNQCMNALRMQLDDQDFIFGFPNLNNLSGAKRAGVPPLRKLNYYIKPSLFSGIGVKKTNDLSFSDEKNEYARKLNDKYGSMVFRSAHYLTWRYLNRPLGKYFNYSHKEQDCVTGMTVARVAYIKGIKALVVMEYHFVNKSAIVHLNAFLGQRANENNCLLIVLLSTPDELRFSKTRFFTLPKKFEPREVVLFGQVKARENKHLSNCNWFMQTGDWDAF
ncbi:MAG: GNAT family N-acetyltransferase [Chitinophagaceae bacterium]|nr:GNAT family N-acetyltransferase [Chitinophagaceae bacterium]